MPINTPGRWQIRFPDPEEATADGLLAYGGNLEPQTLICAYSQSIFPWYSEGDPILWWSPDPRCILLPAAFQISARSRRKIRNSGFRFSVDRAFREVIQGCALPRGSERGAWLLPEMQAAYARLHDLGYAHSVEIWQGDRLAGGIYGVAIGNAFFGESMFRQAPEASRAALLCLVALMRKHDMAFLDCQQDSPHMLAMGACRIPRREFVALAAKACDQSGPDWVAIRQDLAPIENILPLS